MPSADSSSDVQSSAGPEPTDDNEPLSSADVQAQVQAIYEEIEQILAVRLPAILKGLSTNDQDYSTYTLSECFKGCLNNVVSTV